MDATPRSDCPIPAGSGLAAAARAGDRDALRELGARGGKRAHERQRERKAAIVADVTLATVDDRKAALEWAMGRLKASGLDEARLATATAALIREYRAEAGVEEMAAELERLRAAVANAQAMAGKDYECTHPEPLPRGGATAPSPTPDSDIPR